jgi:hypothetical protein
MLSIGLKLIDQGNKPIYIHGDRTRLMDLEQTVNEQLMFILCEASEKLSTKVRSSGGLELVLDG